MDNKMKCLVGIAGATVVFLSFKSCGKTPSTSEALSSQAGATVVTESTDYRDDKGLINGYESGNSGRSENTTGSQQIEETTSKTSYGLIEDSTYFKQDVRDYFEAALYFNNSIKVIPDSWGKYIYDYCDAFDRRDSAGCKEALAHIDAGKHAMYAFSNRIGGPNRTGDSVELAEYAKFDYAQNNEVSGTFRYKDGVEGTFIFLMGQTPKNYNRTAAFTFAYVMYYGDDFKIIGHNGNHYYILPTTKVKELEEIVGSHILRKYIDGDIKDYKITSNDKGKYYIENKKTEKKTEIDSADEKAWKNVVILKKIVAATDEGKYVEHPEQAVEAALELYEYTTWKGANKYADKYKEIKNQNKPKSISDYNARTIRNNNHAYAFNDPSYKTTKGYQLQKVKYYNSQVSVYGNGKRI